jgi:hypothetical protein
MQPNTWTCVNARFALLWVGWRDPNPDDADVLGYPTGGSSAMAAQ